MDTPSMEMDLSTKETGLMINNMDLEKRPGLMVTNTSASTQMA